MYFLLFIILFINSTNYHFQRTQWHVKEVDPRQAENEEGDPEKEIVKEDAEEIDQGKFNEILRQDLYLNMCSYKQLITM